MNRRWIGFLSSWALFILAAGLATIAVAGEWINIRDLRRLQRVEAVDRMIEERMGVKTESLRTIAQKRAGEVNALASRVATIAKQTEDLPDTGQTIIVSTAENKLYVRRDGQTVMETLCSTGSGMRLAIDGRTRVFNTPIGRFRVKQKETNPEWVPPDWHYVEEAQKHGMKTVRLTPGMEIDADTGVPARRRDEGVWGWFGGGSRRVLRVRGNSVVLDEGGYERPLPQGKTIVAGGAVVIPPVTVIQRRYPEVLGRYRLNLGDGYAIHGTNQPDKLGQAVSHGCIRLGDADIEQLFQMTNVGDEVIIY